MAKNGGKKRYSVRVDKSYWLFESEGSEDVYETDCGKKRAGDEVYGPSNKKIKSDIIRSENDDEKLTNNVDNTDNEKNGIISTKERCCECGTTEADGNKFIINEMFDDIESISSDYDDDKVVITDLFNDIESAASVNYQDINDSDDESSFLPDLLDFFDNVSSDDDEDRVIITEIFDDINNNP